MRKSYAKTYASWAAQGKIYQRLDGRAFRILTVIDQLSRESVSLEANFR